jgi:VIT1/CCC1 family predicted Fe2+/Mn2+ transporter
MEKITDKTLAIVGTATTVLAIYFIVPHSIAIISAILVIVIAGVLNFLKSRWV